MPARRPELLRAAPTGLPCLKRISHCGAVALDGRHQLLRERVHDARADAVEAAGGLVAAVLELAARVKHREDHFERALLGRRMLVDRNAAAVVFDGDRRSVGVERHPNVRGVAVHRLVDGVVEDFPDEVVQTRPIRRLPIYMPGRFRTGSSPSRTVMSFAV